MLELRSRQKTTSLFSGDTRSVRKGGGTEYVEGRPYTGEDDAHSIDWRTSARLPSPSVKLYEASHELQVCLMIDIDHSLFLDAGRAIPSKSDHLGSILEKVLESCEYSRHGLSLILGEVYIPPGRGVNHREHIHSMIEKYVGELGAGKKKGISSPSLMNRAIRHRIHDSLILYITDRVGGERVPHLQHISIQNDVIYVYISHFLEEYPEKTPGSILLSDGENTGSVDISQIEEYRQSYRQYIAHLREQIEGQNITFWRTYSGEEKWEEKWNYAMRVR